MSKAKRSLLFSLFTLIMAVAITATSTYAWFVVNKEVTASNMQVTVKSDTTYLVISSASTTVTSGALNSTDTTLSVTASSAEVLPVRYNEGATPASGNTKWETASGTSYTNGAALNSTYTPVTTANASKYYVLYTFYVGLTETTAQAATNLRVKEMAVTKAANDTDETMKGAVSALVTCHTGSDAATEVDYEDIDSINAAGYSAKGNLAATVALNTVYEINVYVYMDGDHSSIKSENGAKLGSFKLSITFEVTAA